MKGSEQTNAVYSLGQNRTEKRRLMNSYDFMSEKMMKSKSYLLEKIKSSSTQNFEKPAFTQSSKQLNRNYRSVPKKIALLEYENGQEPEFDKVSYRLRNFQYFDQKNEHASDFQKRELIKSKNQSLNSLHISHMNLDSSFKSRSQSRNKSANNNDLFIAPASRMNPRSVAQKNYIDLNIQEPLYQSPTNSFNQSANYQMIALYQPNRAQSSRTSHHNLKIINDSNKFLEDVLAHSKRKTLNSNQFTNTSYQSFYSNSPTVPVANNYLIINRTNEERNLFPDKLIMDRRNLIFCPKIEGEDTLKLINYQHNQIRSIQNLESMKNLIFLDLYDNRIEKINGLTNLINLRVLMLGKNKIQKIENLENLIYLDILDLHGNLISKIENLNSLKDLRVLNIAANEIKIVENLTGLNSLVELNLRRNKIEEIKSLDYLQKLQRLFLSHNQISSLQWLGSVNSNVQELTLDNNPISNESNYRLTVLSQVNTLRKLDSKRVTDNEKRMAYNYNFKENKKNFEFDTQSRISARIQDAENDWIMRNQNEKSLAPDLANSELLGQNSADNDYEVASFNNVKILKDDSPSRIDNKNFEKSSFLNSPCSSTYSFKDYSVKPEITTDARIQSASSSTLKKNISNQTLNGQKRLPAQNCSTVQQDSTMMFYGSKSLEILDIKLDQLIQNQITTLSFHYMDFDELLSKNFFRLKNKFPNTVNLVFTCCNIKHLNQLFSLLDWKRLDSVTINKEDNPVSLNSFWKYFVLNYLNTLQLRKINNNFVTRTELNEKLFSPLSNLIFTMSDHRLMGILKREKKKLNRPSVTVQTNDDDDDPCTSFKNE
ncbi:Leucine-rich repeat-containing, partial [Brachionus plicatilis]